MEVISPQAPGALRPGPARSASGGGARCGNVAHLRAPPLDVLVARRLEGGGEVLGLVRLHELEQLGQLGEEDHLYMCVLSSVNLSLYMCKLS